MNKNLTVLSVIIAHIAAITGLCIFGGCRSSSGMESRSGTRAFSGFPGESGASGYEAGPTTVVNQPAPSVRPATAGVNPPSPVTVVEPAPAPVSVNEPAPAPVSVNEPVPVEPAPAPVGTGRVYTVRKNESLWIIAKREGVSIDDIIAANHLNKNAVLREGQKLTIPAASGRKSVASVSGGSAKPVVITGDAYVVKSGDSISVIARKLGTTSAALREANGLKGDAIRAGQKLAIPAGAKNKAAATTGASGEAKKASVSAPAANQPAAPAAESAPVSGGLRDVPLMGAPGAAPAPVSAAPAAVPAAPEAVEATPVSK